MREPADTSSGGRTRATLLRRACSILSAALLAFLALCYVGRFDFCVAVTVFPPWVWLAPGLLFAASECMRGDRRVGMTIIGLWFVFLLVFADTPASLFRGLARSVYPAASAESGRAGTAFRVVTLNCATSAKAAAEVTQFRPDVVLLQESPSRASVEALAERLYGGEGGVLWGPDASIIARGCVTPVETPASRRGDCVHARVRFASGAEVAVISLRLLPSTFRLDLWAPNCWRDYANNRRKRRAQLAAIVQETRAIPSEVPLILGGDFNAPVGDAVFRVLRPRLVDAYRRAGIGWGNTIVNDWPMLRIDQVWVSDHFSPSEVHARKTEHSDHRMVVCDLTLDDR